MVQPHLSLHSRVQSGRKSQSNAIRDPPSHRRPAAGTLLRELLLSLRRAQRCRSPHRPNHSPLHRDLPLLLDHRRLVRLNELASSSGHRPSCSASARRPIQPRAPIPPAHRAPMAPSPGDPSETTIDDLMEHNIQEILLRLHSSLSLSCAMLFCRRWASIASKPGFHKIFRETHPSSPLIGLFTNEDDNPFVSRPRFRLIDKSDSDMDAVIQKADFFLCKLKGASGARWRIEDSRNGVLLLCRDDDNSLYVHNPVSGRQLVRIQDRPDDVTMDGKFVAHCLLDGTVQQCVAVDSFQVVSVQLRQRGRKIRAVVYDSSTSVWHCHEWTSQPPDGGCLLIHPEWGRPMYAAGRIFWVYSTAFLFVLDTGTMEFLARPFPRKWKQPDKLYSIGEIEDGTGYLVCLRGKSLLANNCNPRLQVWSINADNNKLELDLKKEVPMSQLAIPPLMSCHVYTVINGLAVAMYQRRNRFVVDLEKETVVAEFDFSGRVYLYQLSWPHAINSGSASPLQDNNIDNLLSTLSEGSIRSSHDVGESVHERSGGDEPSKLSRDNKIKEPPTLSYLDNSCSQSQYMDPPDVNEGSANEAAPCESLHILKSRDTPQDGGPRERKKRKTNACPGETTSCDPLVVESETISTTAVSQNSPRVPCRDILVGQQATSQDKHLNEDVLNCPQRSGSPRKSRRKEVAHPKGARRTRSSHVVHDSTSLEAETTS